MADARAKGGGGRRASVDAGMTMAAHMMNMAAGPAERSGQPLREGYMGMEAVAISAGGKKGRRKSITDLISKKKENDFYFVLTPQQLYHFGTKEDYKAYGEPIGIMNIEDVLVEAMGEDGVGSSFRLRSASTVHTFTGEDEAVVLRWLTAVRAVQLGAMTEWSESDLAKFGALANFAPELSAWLASQSFDGNRFARIKDMAQLSELGYNGPSDALWDMLHSTRTAGVQDWLTRFVAFCRRNAEKRELESAEVMTLVRLGKALEIMNTLNGQKDGPSAEELAMLEELEAATEDLEGLGLSRGGEGDVIALAEDDSDEEDEMPEMVAAPSRGRRASISLAEVEEDDC